MSEEPDSPGAEWNVPNDDSEELAEIETISSRLYRRFPVLLIARRNLTRSRSRTALAMLGIVIGVIAIASLGLFGATLQQSAVGSLGDIGNQVIVSPAFEEGVETLTDRDVRAIRRAAGDASVVPVKQKRAIVAYGDERRVVTVYGMENPAETYDAQSGRIPDPLQSGAVLGASVTESLGVRTGNSITVENRTYRIRAVLERQGGFSPINPDSAVILPEDHFDEEGYSQVIVMAESGQAANRTAMAIKADLNRREKRVSVMELRSFTQQIGEFFDTLNLFLIGIGSISLLVAGVSILNVMLMSTIERREEIGVLRAVGYQRLDVLRIVLTESLLLGLIGGVIGATLSIASGLLISHLMLGDATRAFTLTNAGYVVAALFFGIVTSVVSGFYPAYKAANEQPVDALRQ
ncbi:MAG: ABC transporter permease [Halodesulfurarchaeum sp.]